MARKTKINIIAGVIMELLRNSFIVALLCTAFSIPALATYTPFNTTVNMNVGIGTSSPGSNLSVLGSESLGAYATIAAPAGGLIISGNVGIGTSTPQSKFVVTNGNVGIGTWTTTNLLDVNGDVAVGDAYAGTSTAPANGMIVQGDVGIGTTFVGGAGEAGLSVMNGNVGIGTWVPAAEMDVNGQYRSIQSTTTVILSAATINWNNGNVQYVQLVNGAQTFTFTNPQGGARYMLILKQPGSSSAGTVTWPATVLFPSDTAPTLTTTNSKVDVITFVYDSTNNKYYGGSSLAY
jgi:hypothetical protein